MKSLDKNKLVVVSLLIAILLVVGVSYAYFALEVKGNDSAENMTINAGKMELTFKENNVLDLSNVKPGDSKEKTFMVTNTGSVDGDYKYNIKLTELDVTFIEEDLQYTLIEYDDESFERIKDGGISRSGYINSTTKDENGEMYLATDIEEPHLTKAHYYKLTIEFKELNKPQDYNQGATFRGKINIDGVAKVQEYGKGKPFSEIIVANDSDVLEDGTEQNNIRYVGAEPNNYIWFNCIDYTYLTQETAPYLCEKWRIIGLMKDITIVDGQEESDKPTKRDLVKIIRADRIENIEWDSAGKTNWPTASLQQTLTNYYNGNAINNARGITASTQIIIEKVRWNIGAQDTVHAPASQYYTSERGSVVPAGAQPTWDGYIALMYASDYGYAAGSSCYSTYLSYYNNGCYVNDWLFTGITIKEWTLTSQLYDLRCLYPIVGDGKIWGENAEIKALARPSLYLKSSVGVLDDEISNGSSENPYILIP